MRNLHRFAAELVLEFFKRFSPIFLGVSLAKTPKKGVEQTLVWAIDTVCRLPRKNLEQYQLRRINKVLADMKDPLVKDWYPLSRLNDLSDIKSFPILAREKLNAFFDKFPKNLQEKFLLITTSGSTGVPLRLYFSKKLFLRRVAAIPYELRLAGAGAPLLRLNFPKEPYYAWHGAYLDPYALEPMGEAAVERFLDRHRPRTLLGTVTHAILLAEFFEKTSLSYPFQAVLVTGEHLSEAQRQYLQKTLGGKCYRVYGCNEFGHIGQECREQNGIHINEDWIFFEILKENGEEAGENEGGEVIITSLHNAFPPVIRYRLGDRARLLGDICPCGLSTRRILLEGRASDFIHLPNGSRIAFMRIISLMGEMQWVNKYQFIQHSANSIEIRIVPRGMPSSELPAILKRKIRHCLAYSSPDLEIIVRFVPAINPSPRGKTKILSSTLHAPSPIPSIMATTDYSMRKA